MKRDDLVYICAMTANLSGLPIRLYEGDRLLSHFSMTPLPRDPILLVRPEITAIDRHVGFYISKRFYVYGVVSSGTMPYFIHARKREIQAGLSSMTSIAERFF